MREFMSSDRAQHTILPLSKFGLMQITRERVRPEVKIDTSEVCPSCKGSGKVNPTLLVTDEIERDMEYIMQSKPKSKIKLMAHPFVYAYLKRGLPNKQMRWYRKFSRWVKVHENADYGLTEYKFFDERDDEIRLN